jgi:hypothetical protein
MNHTKNSTGNEGETQWKSMELNTKKATETAKTATKHTRPAASAAD